jgi:5,10-methylene-tetrahydrofolate dehydrogenase/methenyl tetrahydrofolate cyclohydrolase
MADADILISAVGKPGIVKAELVKPGAVVVDAGVASEDGVLKRRCRRFHLFSAKILRLLRQKWAGLGH